ncbi:hypothetical protein KEM52_001816 [Ascosphaera acerosa]|nr:hypothetical protein KEM52_001816 [Ascosphaera acerosa]
MRRSAIFSIVLAMAFATALAAAVPVRHASPAQSYDGSDGSARAATRASVHAGATAHEGEHGYARTTLPKRGKEADGPSDTFHSWASDELTAWAAGKLASETAGYTTWLGLWWVFLPTGVRFPDTMPRFAQRGEDVRRLDSYKGRIETAMAQSVYNMARVASGVQGARLRLR